MGQHDDARDQIQRRGLPAAVDPRKERHARDFVIDGVDRLERLVEQGRAAGLDREADLGNTFARGFTARFRGA